MQLTRDDYHRLSEDIALIRRRLPHTQHLFYDEMMEHLVMVHILKLRKKLEDDPANPAHIVTKWGVGYYFKG